MMAVEAAQSLVDGNINLKLPPEILSNIFQFLTFVDLKQALLVCRYGRPSWQHIILQVVEAGWGEAFLVGQAEATI